MLFMPIAKIKEWLVPPRSKTPIENIKQRVKRLTVGLNTVTKVDRYIQQSIQDHRRSNTPLIDLGSKREPSVRGSQNDTVDIQNAIDKIPKRNRIHLGDRPP